MFHDASGMFEDRQPDRSFNERDSFSLMGPSENQSASNKSMI